jgi:hypothetical protein
MNNTSAMVRITGRALAAFAAAAMLTLAAPLASGATTGLTFAGGCPESAGAPFCAGGPNATEANVAEILGVALTDVTQITSGFSVTGVNSQSGTWAVTDPAITHLAFKSNGYFILGERTAASGEWMNDTTAPGGWDISLVTCPASICGAARPYATADFLNNGGNVADLSNVRAFSVVPLPAAVWLFASAIGLLGWSKRRS